MLVEGPPIPEAVKEARVLCHCMSMPQSDDMVFTRIYCPLQCACTQGRYIEPLLFTQLAGDVGLAIAVRRTVQ